MGTKWIVPVSFIALLLSSLTTVRLESEERESADRTAIQGAIADFIDAYNSGNVDRLMTVYGEDFLDISEGAPTISGKEALSATESRLRNTFSKFKGELSVSTDQISVSGDHAFAHGTFQVVLKPVDGGEDILIRRRFLEIWSKQANGSWKVVASMDNELPSP